MSHLSIARQLSQLLDRRGESSWFEQTANHAVKFAQKVAGLLSLYYITVDAACGTPCQIHRQWWANKENLEQLACPGSNELRQAKPLCLLRSTPYMRNILLVCMMNSYDWRKERGGEEESSQLAKVDTHTSRYVHIRTTAEEKKRKWNEYS